MPSKLRGVIISKLNILMKYFLLLPVCFSDLCCFSAVEFLSMLCIFPQAVEVFDEILKIKREIETELFGEEQNWGRSETNVSAGFFFAFHFIFFLIISIKYCPMYKFTIYRHDLVKSYKEL